MRSLFLSLTLLTCLTKKRSVQAHFLFTKLNDDEQGVKVFFSEPVAMEGQVIKYVADRLDHLTMIAPSFKSNGDTHTITLELDDAGFVKGDLPEKLDNTPYFLTGFLDYGDFGEGDGPKVDLQYTFSSQISSTNPSDDWAHFFHYVAGTDAKSPYGEDNDNDIGDPFAIALNNYGPPTRVVMRGVSADTPVHVCIYEGNGSNREVGCVEGTHNRTHHLTFDAEALGVLHPCETYFALANTTGTDEVTGKGKHLWASTSVTWNGPCNRKEGLAPNKAHAPVPQWYEPTHFNFNRGGGCAHSSSNSSSTSSSTSVSTPSKSATDESVDSSVAMLLLFTGGFLAGMLVYHILMQYVRCCNSQFKVVSTDEKTVDYRDDASSSEML